MSLPLATTSVSPTTEQLVRAARAGELSALAGLYDRYAALLFRSAYRLTGSSADAEDVIQDVFVGLPEALRAYAEMGSFEAWITRVTVRVALMRARRSRRRNEAPLEEAESTTTTDRPDRCAERAEVRRAVMSLPASLRDVVVLKQLEGYSHEEVGALLGISAGASRVRLARALEALRRMLR